MMAPASVGCGYAGGGEPVSQVEPDGGAPGTKPAGALSTPGDPFGMVTAVEPGGAGLPFVAVTVGPVGAAGGVPLSTVVSFEDVLAAAGTANANPVRVPATPTARPAAIVAFRRTDILRMVVIITSSLRVWCRSLQGEYRQRRVASLCPLEGHPGPLSGVLVYHLDRRSVDGADGMVRRGSWHTLANPGPNHARFLIILCPPGYEGFGKRWPS